MLLHSSRSPYFFVKESCLIIIIVLHSKTVLGPFGGILHYLYMHRSSPLKTRIQSINDGDMLSEMHH